jgi:zinc/manganese transport system permease protein
VMQPILTVPKSLPIAATLPPFTWNLVGDVQAMLRYDFMHNAFLCGTMVAVVAGLVGYFVLLRQLAFAGDALSHFAFTGALGAVLVDLSPLAGAFGLTVLVALVIGGLGERARARDVVVGTLLAWTLGLGVLLLSIYTTTASAANSALGVKVLFGSILGIQAQQGLFAAAVAAAVVVALLLIARPLLFVSLDPDVAAARGLPVRLLGAAFMVLLAVTVAEATQVVGALLIFALLITPAAIAQRVSVRPYRAMLLAAMLALAITWIGLTLAFYTSYPVSFLISALAFLAYSAVILWQRAASWRLRRPSPALAAA